MEIRYGQHATPEFVTVEGALSGEHHPFVLRLDRQSAPGHDPRNHRRARNDDHLTKSVDRGLVGVVNGETQVLRVTHALEQFVLDTIFGCVGSERVDAPTITEFARLASPLPGPRASQRFAPVLGKFALAVIDSH